MKKTVKGYIIAMRFGCDDRPPLYVNLLANDSFLESIDQAFIFPTKEVAEVFAEIVYNSCKSISFYVENDVYPCVEYHKRKEIEI